MWAGGNSVTTQCPKSEIRGESVAWVEMYGAATRFGPFSIFELDSRDGEAMLVLAGEAERTKHDEERR